MKRKSIILLIITSISIISCKSVNPIVNKIAEINELQYYGQSRKYPNFENFELLKKKASITQLLKLTDNKNPVVVGYSSFALVDLNYPKIDEIFYKILKENNKVSVLGGCIGSEEELSVEFYKYFDSESKFPEKNKIISKLDSISIYVCNSSYLIELALEKKMNENHNQQIKYLAYQKYNIDALFYISNWSIEKDKEKLKRAWLNYIDNTKLSRENLGYYYSEIEKLLEFKDNEINSHILSKLISNKDEWEYYDKEKFEDLFSKYKLKIE